MHERDLYNTNEPSAIDQFAADVMKQYPHLAQQTEYADRVRDRCELIVRKFAESWMEWEREGYGFLREVSKKFRKSPEFEKAWSLRRIEWLNQVHHGSSDQVIEWCETGISSVRAKEHATERKTRVPHPKTSNWF